MFEDMIKMSHILNAPVLTQEQSERAIAALLQFYGCPSEEVMYEKGFPELVEVYDEVKATILSKVQ